MSSAPELLTLCAASGVELWEENGRLRYHGAAAVVAPILPDLARFKLALLELLTAPEAPATEPATPSPFRRVNEFVFVPCDFEAAPSVARIAALLQSFEPLFAAARRGHLLDSGEPGTAAAACEIEKQWSDRARECQREQRNLTAAEFSALECAAAWLESARSEAPEVRR